MSEPIGGYFELELLDRGGFLHDDGVLLNSGRNALEYVLRSLQDVQHLWIPFFTCDVILEPIVKLSIPYSFYHIKESLEISEPIVLKSGEYLLYTNYFGIKDQYVQQLADQYGAQLIVDNAQAFFADPVSGISTIYSPRKFVGVPDGGIAYCKKGIDPKLFERDCSYDCCSHLLKRIDLGPSGGYQDFKDNGRSLANQPIRRMSRLTERLLRSIDFDSVKQKRKKNFLYLNERLGKNNLFSWMDYSTFACPMVYPFLSENPTLRRELIDNNIFIATYWPNVLNWVDEEETEHELTVKLLSLPCDQRYGMEGMNRIINEVLNQ